MNSKIDVSKAKWELSDTENQALKWFNENEFSVRLENQHVSKTIFTIEKDGIKDKFELPKGITDIESYMNQYKKTWSLICELNRLKGNSHNE